MKKHTGIALICALLLSVFMLSACQQTSAPEKPVQSNEQEQKDKKDEVVSDNEKPEDKKAESVSIRIGAPAGAPTLSMIRLEKEKPSLGEGVETTYEVIKSPDVLASKLMTGELDIAVVPSNLAIKLYNKDVDYKYAGSTVWGILYIISTEEFKSWSDLKGKEIYNIGRGLTPDIVTRTLMKANGLDPDKDVTFNYLSGGQELAQYFIAGKSKISIMPEPMLTKVLMKKKEGKVNFDLQEEWAKMTGVEGGYPQASLVIKGELIEKHPEIVKDFLKIYGEGVDWVNAHPEKAGAYSEELNTGMKAPVVKGAIPRSHLKFKGVAESKESLETYYKTLFDVSPKLIGGKMPDEGFYYQGK